jgi:hypothetical protein
MEDLSFENELNNDLNHPTEKDLGTLKNELKKYLEPPYTFDLPPNGKKLMPSDSNYEYYLCRVNAGQNIGDAIQEIIMDKNIYMKDSVRERLFSIVKEIFAIYLNESNRTEEEMLKIKSLTEEAWGIVSQLEAYKTQSTSA